MKNSENNFPPKVEKRTNSKIIIQEREYELITPLYGGGVEKNSPDPITIVRPSEIKSHLRFWWRALYGGDFDRDLNNMRKKEFEIFGASSDQGGPSDFQIEIISSSYRNKTSQLTTYHNNYVNIGDIRSPWSYVTFPLREYPSVYLLEGVNFRIKLLYSDDFKEQIERSILAWEFFGGIGARTRKGFGALKLISGKSNCESNFIYPNRINFVEVKKQIINLLDNNGIWPDNIPNIDSKSNYFLREYRNIDSIVVWQKLFNKLKEFRQGFRGEGHRGRGRGRTYWPEPDAIRRRNPNNGGYRHQPNHQVDKFPRAYFGLPIEFNFIDNHDPDKKILQGINSDRYASRLILRPIECDQSVVGVALVLNGPIIPEGGLELKNSRNQNIEYILTKDEAQNIEPLNGEPDVLKAFIKYLGGDR